MKFVKLALAVTLLQLLASCAPPEGGTLTGKIKQAEQGDAWAQSTLGDAYRDGEGVPQDYAQAVNWYRKAAEQGNAWAQLSLGDAYRDGEGVPQDYAQAVNWYRKSAEQGNLFAQTALSDAYRNGEGVSQDDGQSVFWRAKAAEQGDASAQTDLSNSYEKGEGVLQDQVLAYAWMNLAVTSRQAELVAARKMEEPAPDSLGIQESSDRIYRQNAAESRLKVAQTTRDSLADKLSPPQLAEAQRLSSSWQKGQSIQRDKQ